MTSPGVSKLPGVLDPCPSTYPTSSEGPLGVLSPTLGFPVYHRSRGGGESQGHAWATFLHRLISQGQIYFSNECSFLL